MVKDFKEKRIATLGGPARVKRSRYRRYQALNDALELYFAMLDHPGWYDWKELADLMEWEVGKRSATGESATRKRVQRMMYALERLGRVDVKRTTSKYDAYLYRVAPRTPCGGKH